MKRAMEIVGLVIAGIFTVAFVVDKIYEWAASAKLLKMFEKTEPLFDKMVDYVDDNWGDIVD